MTYPAVQGEFETLAKLRAGYSLARLGDGELKMAHGAGYVRQAGSAQLAAELQGILSAPPARCLVGIPTLDPKGPKYENWLRHRDRFEALLREGVTYYSAFVTRPDSAPWIECRDYCEQLASLWIGKRAAVLCEGKGSMLRAVRPQAGRVVHIRAPHRGAYDVIDRLQAEILAAQPQIAILSAGPAATILAARLSALGVQAVDLGSVGAMVCRVLYAKEAP
jgi:hypothetical protein